MVCDNEVTPDGAICIDAGMRAEELYRNYSLEEGRKEGGSAAAVMAWQLFKSTKGLLLKGLSLVHFSLVFVACFTRVLG